MSKADQEHNDPALGKFLSFLAQDIENNPIHIHPITSELLNRAQSLVGGIHVDLDAPLSDEDEDANLGLLMLESRKLLRRYKHYP